MNFYYNPDDGDFRANAWMGTAANAMYNEYLDYWEQQNVRDDSEFTPEHRAHFGELINVARSLRPLLHSLAMDQKALDAVRRFLANLGAKQEVDSEFAAGIARALREDPIVNHGIQIQLALEAADELLAGAEVRFGDLLELVAARRLSERAGAYLDLSSRSGGSPAFAANPPNLFVRFAGGVFIRFLASSTHEAQVSPTSHGRR